jgi:hypothetical protein
MSTARIAAEQVDARTGQHGVWSGWFIAPAAVARPMNQRGTARQEAASYVRAIRNVLLAVPLRFRTCHLR